MRLTIATWNLQGRVPASVALAERTRAWWADVLLFQEAHGDAIATELAGLRTHLWWPTAGTSPGLVIASRMPAVAQGLIEAGTDPWDRPRVTWATLRHEAGREVTAVNVHLKAPLGAWPPAARRQRDRQRRALASWLTSLDTFVVGGDFNTSEPTLDGAIASAFHSGEPTWRPFGLRSLPPMFRIDAVFAGPGLEIERSSVDGSASGSDHLPVVATIVEAGM